MIKVRLSFIVFCLTISLLALVATISCAKKQPVPQEEQKTPPVAAQVNQPAPSDEEPKGEWITVSLETGIFGPDGKQRRWVKLQPGRAVRLGPGEWVTVHGTKYTGRSGARSEVWLEAGEVKARNVETAPDKN